MQTLGGGNQTNDSSDHWSEPQPPSRSGQISHIKQSRLISPDPQNDDPPIAAGILQQFYYVIVDEGRINLSIFPCHVYPQVFIQRNDSRQKWVQSMLLCCRLIKHVPNSRAFHCVPTEHVSLRSFRFYISHLERWNVTHVDHFSLMASQGRHYPGRRRFSQKAADT